MHCPMPDRGKQVFNFSTFICNQYLECNLLSSSPHSAAGTKQ
ncbi:hypothetical protein NC651_029026 [Populus alba x Populus x berolinensis]|nr:hypothetical protein NC651_029026 [Populus alba x Populus x berolinensis]